MPIDVRIMKEIWSPDVEIRNLKEFKTLKVLSKVGIGDKIHQLRYKEREFRRRTLMANFFLKYQYF